MHRFWAIVLLFLINQNYGAEACWSQWSSCSATCGYGTKFRFYYFTCSLFPVGNTSCYAGSCPVNGNWGSWGSWNICSLTCGAGIKTRTRSCNNPPQSYGGLNCTDSSSDTVDCNTHPCPQNGAWGQWTSLTPCSLTCNGGISVSERQCNSPSAENGGQYCEGNHTLISTCNLDPCPRDNNEMKNYSSPAVVSGVAVSCIVITLFCVIVFITARNRLSANGVKEKQLMTNNPRKHQGRSFDNAEYIGTENMDMSLENQKSEGSCVYENLKY